MARRLLYADLPVKRSHRPERFEERMSISRAWALILVLILAAATPAAAQQVVYSQGFDAPAQGWLLNSLWATDATPASAPGGAVRSGAGSLNFNNGTNYQGTQRGTAASPAISIQGAATLRFFCNYRTETTGTTYDRRSVEVRLNGATVATHVLSSQTTAAAPSRCGAMGTWHRHDVAVPAPAGAATPASLQVVFVFDSVDAQSNAFPGWFVDDLAVETRAPIDAFSALSRTTRDFRDFSVRTSIRPDKSVEIARSSPTARFALVTGQATAAEHLALVTALNAASLSTIAQAIPDPNTYIVAPTTFSLEVTSAVAANQNTIGGSLGVYGQWSARLAPVMQAIQVIENRLLGGGASGDDHGNDVAGATELDSTANHTTAGEINPAGDVDFFRVVDPTPIIMIYPPPQKTYTIEASVVGNMDTVIDVYAADGTTLLGTNDDAAGLGMGSRVAVTIGQGSLLYVKVRHYSATGQGTYAIRATGGSQPGAGVDDHGNSAAAATQIQVGGAATAGSIGAAGDVDWFKFVQPGIAIFPPPAVTFTIQTTVNGTMDTVIELYAADGTTLLASNDDGAGLGYASKIVYTGTVKTGYSLKVRHYGATGTGSYTLSVTAN